MKHLPWKLFTAAISTAIVFDILFYKAGGAGLNIFLFQIIIVLMGLGIALYLDHHVATRTVVSAVFTLLFSFTFVIWTSEIGLSLSALGLVVSNALFALYLMGHHGKFHHPVSMAFEASRRYIETLITRVEILSHLKFPRISTRNNAVFRGILISIPVVVIFGSLFLASDLVLQQRVSNFSDWFDTFSGQDIVAQLFIIAVVAFIFLLFFAAAFWKRFTFDDFNSLVSQHRTESAIVLLSANALFGLFIIVQSVYLFGGQNAWAKIEGISYSDYAVQGFNELATVAVLVILLILTLRYFHAERVNKKVIRAAEVFLLAETLTIVISAWVRMSLYVQQYDFTPARLFGFWFFALAAVLLVLLAAHIIAKTSQYKYLQQALVVCAVAMLVFTMSTPDALAVKMNINRAEDGKIAAFPLFNQLSAEAYPVMEKVLLSEDYDIGLITNPAEYCEYVEQSATVGINAISPSPDNVWVQDINLRADLQGFQSNLYTDYYVDKDGDGEKESRTGWRAWNYAREQIPRLQDGKPTQDFEAREISDEAIIAACGFSSTTPVDSE